MVVMCTRDVYTHQRTVCSAFSAWWIPAEWLIPIWGRSAPGTGGRPGDGCARQGVPLGMEGVGVRMPRNSLWEGISPSHKASPVVPLVEIQNLVYVWITLPHTTTGPCGLIQKVPASAAVSCVHCTSGC